MDKDLTLSGIDRQNILNNPFAMEEAQKAINLSGIGFKGGIYFTKEQVAQFFEVDERTIERYLQANEAELKQNGYVILRGKALQELKKLLKEPDAPDINVGSKTTQLGLFGFRSFLNLGMLLSESERARLLRQTILDIAIDTVNVRTGGGTKYINQRDEDFVVSFFKEENYRKEFTDALNLYVDMGNFKYPMYTDKIYVSIFRENSTEYRKILKLHDKERVRNTFYSEVLDLVASYEYGFAEVIRQAFLKKGAKLDAFEVDGLFRAFEAQALWKPLVEKARMKMASRDMAFRDALHLQLKEYIVPLQAEEFERFLGEKSKELVERLAEAEGVFKRLKERG